MIFVENAEHVVNISQPKRRCGVKSCNSCVFDMVHVKKSNNGIHARTHRSAKDLFEKKAFVRNYNRKKTLFGPIVMLEISREVLEDKDSSEVSSSETRSKILSVETDVIKLSTSKEAKILFSDILGANLQDLNSFINFYIIKILQTILNKHISVTFCRNTNTTLQFPN